MTKDIVLIGAGGHAREIAYLIDDMNSDKKDWNILGFIDRDDSNVGKMNGKYPIIGDEQFFMQAHGVLNCAIAIGNPVTVKHIFQRLSTNFRNTLQFPNLIHPTVKPYLRETEMEEGTLLCAGNIFTTNIKLGAFTCVNRGCNISHDVVIGDFSIVNPGANISGGVKIGTECLIGTGSTILQYITIGNQVTVGAGSVVTKDVANSMTVMGVPARANRT